ncbi:MAG: hypothetical protein H8E84_05195 [Flavobacteriales bacterium]|nr:hypothetical protein [Flavobacteriales bacterium]
MKTYTYQTNIKTENGFAFPSYLGLGILQLNTITEIDNGAFGEYYVQSEGRLTNELDFSNKQILKSDISPFSSISNEGSGIILPVFLKDAINLMKREGVIGKTKETAVRVLYV